MCVLPFLTARPNGLIGPELRSSGGRMVVYDFSGKQYDADATASAFGDPIDVVVLIFAKFAVAAFRARESPSTTRPIAASPRHSASVPRMPGVCVSS